MNRIYRTLAQFELDSRNLQLGWALLGGLAVSARSEPRTTRDVDVAIAVENDKEAEEIVRDLLSLGYHLHPAPQIEQETTKRLATIRLLAQQTNEEDVVVDLLFASSGIEPEIVAAAQVFEITDTLAVPVALTGHLLALKTLAGRPSDLSDLTHLLANATDEDIELAHEALALITRRKFHRDKDLHMEFAKHLENARRLFQADLRGELAT